MTFRTFAAALAAAAFIVAPAFAQTPPAPQDPDDLTDPQHDELYCVYQTLRMKDAAPIRDYYLRDMKETGVAARKLFTDAEASCTAQYRWTTDQAEVAGLVGTSAMLTDLISAILLEKGVDDARVEALGEVGANLTVEDLDNLVVFETLEDQTWKSGLKKRISDAGVSKDDEVLEMAVAWLRFTFDEYDGAMIWIEDKLY